MGPCTSGVAKKNGGGRLRELSQAVSARARQKWETRAGTNLIPQVVAYVLTCVWGIARATLCFKYNAKLRKALGP